MFIFKKIRLIDQVLNNMLDYLLDDILDLVLGHMIMDLVTIALQLPSSLA